MTSVVQSPYTSEQITAWLRGLLTLAWADGDFDAEEQKLIVSLTESELSPSISLETLQPITAKELAAVLGSGTPTADNFMRTAVMVAVADGIYTACEDRLLQEFGKALGQKQEVMKALRYTLCHPETAAATKPGKAPAMVQAYPLSKQSPDALRPVREWLDGLEVHDPKVARFLAKMIPSQCPFERDVKLFGNKVVHIPPLCKLNPLYDQLVGLRFRALSYLADKRGEDISEYC